MIHAAHSRLNSVLIAFVVAALPCPMRAEGSQGIHVAPDTVYLDKVGNQTVLNQTVKVIRTGPPGAALTFTASASTSSGGTWLAVTPASGTVPGDVTITGTAGTLAAGTYYGKVTVTPSSPGINQGIAPAVVNVVLRILALPGGAPTAPAVSVRPGELDFEMVQGGANPDNRTLNIASPTGGTGFNWTAAKTVTTPAGGTWLQIAPASGSGPGSIAVSVNGTALVAGQYNGSVTVTSGSTTAQVPVSLEVKPAKTPQLVIDPDAFNFIIHPGQPVPAPKTLRVKNAGTGTLSWTAAATSSGWLSIGPASGSTPANIALTVNPSGLAAGMYEGSVKVTAAGQTRTARVFLRFVGQPANTGAATTPNQAAVQISPQAVEFSAPVGGPASPASIPVQITSKITGLAFTASGATARGGNWLNLSPANGSVPGTISVTASAAGLTAGLYTGIINIKVQGSVSEQRVVVVTLRVGTQGETPRFTLQPGTVVFQAVSGGPGPAPAQVTLSARGAASIPFSVTLSTSGGGNWLSGSPVSGTAPAAITVNAANLASLTPGVYSGAIVFQATGATGALPATLNVMLVVRPASTNSPAAGSQGAMIGTFLTPAEEFVAARNGAQAVQVMLFSSDGTPVEGADVEVNPSSGEPGFTLEDAGGGLYTALFHSQAGGPLVLNAVAATSKGSASFSVGGDVDGAASTLPAIFQGGIVNAANFSAAPTPLVPGSILTLFGKGLTDSTMSAAGFPLPRDLGGVKVLVAGIEAPLIAAVSDSGQGYDQIVFQAPVELRAVTFADVVVVKDGTFSAPEGIGVAVVLPALFTGNGQGTGRAAALHADYSPVTSDSPARPGETIVLFSTGLGDVQPSQASGQAAGNNSRVSADVQVTFAGRPARTDFAGLAPGYSGLYQINVTVPADIAPGDAALLITVGGIGSGEGVVVPIGKP